MRRAGAEVGFSQKGADYKKWYRSTEGDGL